MPIGTLLRLATLTICGCLFAAIATQTPIASPLRLKQDRYNLLPVGLPTAAVSVYPQASAAPAPTSSPPRPASSAQPATQVHTAPPAQSAIVRDQTVPPRPGQPSAAPARLAPPATVPPASPAPPSHVSSGNPLAGWRLYVDPNSPAAKQVVTWQAARPADAAAIEKIASHAQAIWLAGTHPSASAAAQTVTASLAAARAQSAVPVFVLYAIPQRDCGGLAAGGFDSKANYQAWIQAISRSIGRNRAIVILEPDALDGLDCLTPADQQTREDLLAQAVHSLKSQPETAVYIDAGNPGWKSAQIMAPRLEKAGIAEADGFALNVANFFTTADNIAFGTNLSALVGGKHFIIDTGRNGLGPDPNKIWCNPPGRALGSPPTTQTGDRLADAFLWIKQPGYSDGACRNSAVGYGWWADYALGLAQRASWSDSTAPASTPLPSVRPSAVATPIASTTSAGYGAQVVTQNGSPYLTLSTSYHFQVQLKNTGTKTWTPATVELATANPLDRHSPFSPEDSVHHYPSGWTTASRVILTQPSVGPGQIGTFGFWYSVPSGLANGSYTEAFQLVGQNQAFGPTIQWTITIR